MIRNVTASTNEELLDIDQACQRPLLQCEDVQNKVEIVAAEPVGISIVLDNIGPVDRMSILDSIIGKVLKKYDSRYGMFLQFDSGRKLKAVLEENLNPSVK